MIPWPFAFLVAAGILGFIIYACQVGLGLDVEGSLVWGPIYTLVVAVPFIIVVRTLRSFTGQ